MAATREYSVKSTVTREDFVKSTLPHVANILASLLIEKWLPAVVDAGADLGTIRPGLTWSIKLDEETTVGFHLGIVAPFEKELVVDLSEVGGTQQLHALA